MSQTVQKFRDYRICLSADKQSYASYTLARYTWRLIHLRVALVRGKKHGFLWLVTLDRNKNALRLPFTFLHSPDDGHF